MGLREINRSKGGAMPGTGKLWIIAIENCQEVVWIDGVSKDEYEL